MGISRPAGRDQVRSRTGGFRSPWTFGSILFWRIGRFSAREPSPAPPYRGRGAAALLSGFTDSIRNSSRETNHDLLFSRKGSNSSWNRSSRPCAFSPPSVGRGRGGFSRRKAKVSPKRCSPEESRGDRKASGRARRRGTSLSSQLAGEMPRSGRGAVSCKIPIHSKRVHPKSPEAIGKLPVRLRTSGRARRRGTFLLSPMRRAQRQRGRLNCSKERCRRIQRR